MTLLNAREQSLALLERLRDRGEVKPVGTGLAGLDRVLGGGLRRGLAILGGIPGAGKTAFGLQAGLRAAKAETPFIFYTAEQSPTELLARVLAGAVGKPSRMLLDGEPNTLAAAFEVLDQLPLELTYFESDRQRANGAVASLVDLVREVSDVHGSAPFAVVDYLQRLAPANSDDELRVSIGHTSTRLANLVRDEDVILLVISSLNRAAYRGEVTLDAFKETGSIEFDADQAFILRHSDEPDPAPGAKSITVELHVVKNRTGPCPTDPVLLRFDGELGSFVDHPGAPMDQ